jgi:mannose-6-phosphate isomerase
MSLTEPLTFRPLFKEYVWGGRRLGTVLGKPIGDGDRYAESWEIVDHGDDQSVVATGPLAGRTLHELVSEQGSELLGRHHPQPLFPLLMKFLDAQLTLSVQVHPNDAQGAKLSPPDLGKTEAWVVLAAEPGSKIYAGLKPGVDRGRMEQALKAGKCDECLHQLEPRVGDCIFLEAGTVHALGDGLVIAEIQQASNTTFRLFDWNRVDRDGQPRPLHIEESLDTIDFARGPVAPQVPKPTDRAHVERLVECDKFVLDRWRFDAPQKCGGDERCHLVAVLEGEIAVGAERFQRGQSLLIPAACTTAILAPRGPAVLLDMYLP